MKCRIARHLSKRVKTILLAADITPGAAALGHKSSLIIFSHGACATNAFYSPFIPSDGRGQTTFAAGAETRPSIPSSR